MARSKQLYDELTTTEDKMATCCSQVKKTCIVYNASFKSIDGARLFKLECDLIQC